MVRFESFEALGLSAAAFSDKTDGDCGLKGAEDAAAILHARAVFASQCGVDPRDLVCARQVHGFNVARVEETDRGRGAVDWSTALDATDGLMTNVPGLPLVVSAADCVPVYLFDPAAQVVALLHAGRRGTVGNISGAAVQRLREEYRVRPANLYAFIGPSAGPCCYEVDPQTLKTFQQAGLPAKRNKPDLWQANALQLQSAGVRPERIEISEACTICDGRYYSYRADGTAKRNLALLML